MILEEPACVGSYHFSNIEEGFLFPYLAYFRLKELSEVISEVDKIISKTKMFFFYLNLAATSDSGHTSSNLNVSAAAREALTCCPPRVIYLYSLENQE